MEFKKIRNKKFVLLGLILLFCCVGIFGAIEESNAQVTCASGFLCPLSGEICKIGVGICSMDFPLRMPDNPVAACGHNSAALYSLVCNLGACVSVVETDPCDNYCCNEWKTGFDCSSGVCASSGGPHSIGDCSNLTCTAAFTLAADETCDCGTAVCTNADHSCCASENYCGINCAACDPVIGGDIKCPAAGCPAGQSDPHDACVAGTCQSVSGCGVDDCSACTGCPAGQSDPHDACVAGTCQSVSGCGVDDCSACSGPLPTCGDGVDDGEECGEPMLPACPAGETCQNCICTPSGNGGSTVWPVTFTNPLDAESFEELVASVINWLLAIVGSIVLLFIIIAGIMYMTAAGDEAQLTRAKKMLFYTILGFAIILISYSLIKEIKDILGITS